MHNQDAITPMKKQRLVWTPELHALFVWAVNALGGVDEAVPRKILELMKVTDLTRANVASHLQKYRMQLKGQDEERREASVGHMSLLSQPKVSRRESQWKMDTTAAWQQQQQQMMDQNQWHQQQQIMNDNEQQPLLPVPAFPDTNTLVKIPAPLQSRKAMITMNTGPSFFSDHASATTLFPGENAPTEARVGDPYNPFPKASGFPYLSHPEFGLEQLGSADDFSHVGLQHDWELHNTSLQPDTAIPYQPPPGTIPNMGTIPDTQVNIPCVDNPGPGTILNATSQFMSDENWALAASHLQKYRIQLKGQDEERREASVGHMSLLSQPKFSGRQSQWKMDTTAAWHQQQQQQQQKQQQMMDQNQWHQQRQIMNENERQPLLPVPAFLDTNMLVKIPAPLQSRKAMITMNTGPSFFSDHASATMLFPGENAPTEARVGDPYNPFLKALGFPILSHSEFRLEQLGSANDFSHLGLQYDWELHNTSLQPDTAIPYQPPQSTIPNMGTIPDTQANIPCVDNPGPGTILNATSQLTSDENWALEVFLTDLEQHGGTVDK